MNTLDEVFAVVGVLAWLAILTAVVVAAFRQIRPYKVVGHSPAIGMVVVRWRDDPGHTYWLTPAHLAQQKGLHR